MPKDTLQDSIHNWQADEGMTDATMLASQLEVIADELRTANLIALLSHGAPNRAMHEMIIERLGLA